jgi:hypothetical protein
LLRYYRSWRPLARHRPRHRYAAPRRRISGCHAANDHPVERPPSHSHRESRPFSRAHSGADLERIGSDHAGVPGYGEFIRGWRVLPTEALGPRHLHVKDFRPRSII